MEVDLDGGQPMVVGLDFTELMAVTLGTATRRKSFLVWSPVIGRSCRRTDVELRRIPCGVSTPRFGGTG